MQQAVESQADGWTHAMDWLARYFEQSPRSGWGITSPRSGPDRRTRQGRA